jgi:hypothetical protein
MIPTPNGIETLSLKGSGKDSIIIPLNAAIIAKKGETKSEEIKAATMNPEILPSRLLVLL